jgi:hypothetical protein
MTDSYSEKERRYQEEIDAAIKWYRTEAGQKEARHQRFMLMAEKLAKKLRGEK